jgi:photosystem II stability/assembly factor-like uncharacterized protein
MRFQERCSHSDGALVPEGVQHDCIPNRTNKPVAHPMPPAPWILEGNSDTLRGAKDIRQVTKLDNRVLTKAPFQSVLLLPVVLGVSVMAGMLLMFGSRDGSSHSGAFCFNRRDQGESETEREGLSPGIEFYYRQRLFGNPGIDPEARRFDAFQQIQRMLKPPRSAGSVSWTPIGPGNMAGRIRAIAVDPTNSAVVYAGSAAGGVFRSTDEGKHWAPLMDESPSLSIGAMAVDPHNPSTLFAGTGEPVVFLSKAITLPTFGGVGILKSTDAGLHWSRLPWSGRAGAVTRILLNPVTSDTMLVATRENLQKTTNGGTTWQTNVLSGVITDIRYKESDPAVAFAAVGSDFGGAANGVYRSNSGGERYSWKKLSLNFPRGDSTGRILLATTPAAPELLFALVARPITAVSAGGQTQYAVTDKDFLALMRSSDDGETWERLETNLPADFALGQAFYNFCIAVSPTDGNYLYIGGIELYRSQDGGREFFQVSFGGRAMHIDQHTVCFVPPTGAVYAGNDGGVYRSTNDGNEWQNLGASLETIQFYSVVVDRHNPGRRFGGTQDNGLLAQQLQSKTWLTIMGDVDAGAVAVDSNTIYMMSTLSKIPYRTTNGGFSWMPLGNGFRSDDRSNWLQPMLLHPSDPSKLFTATQYVYLAEDAGSPSTIPQWRIISPDLSTGSMIYESVVSTMAIPPSRSSWIYAGTGDGNLRRCEDIDAANPVWIDASSGLPKRWITRIAVHPGDPQAVFAAVSGYGSGHVFQSTNAGALWIDISSNLPDIPVNALIVAGAAALPKLFIGTDVGVWERLSDGTWYPVGTGLPNVVVFDLAIDSENRLIAATHGRGMWLSQAVVQEEGLTQPEEGHIIVSLFPLPVASKSRVNVRLRRSADETRYEIHDIRGRLKLNGVISEGISGISLETGNLPNGVYLLSCSQGNRTSTHKFLIGP